MEKFLTKSIYNRSIGLKNKPESWCHNSTKCVPELPSQDNTISYIFLITKGTSIPISSEETRFFH